MRSLINPRLKFDVGFGDITIDQAVQEAIALAGILDQVADCVLKGLGQAIVEFDFNGVAVLVCANDCPREVILAYQDVLRSECDKRVGPLRLKAT